MKQFTDKAMAEVERTLKEAEQYPERVAAAAREQRDREKQNLQLDPIPKPLSDPPALKDVKGVNLASLPEDIQLGVNGHPDTLNRGRWEYLESRLANPSLEGSDARPLTWDPTPGSRPHFEAGRGSGDNALTAPLAIPHPTGMVLLPGERDPEYAVARWVCGERGEVGIQGSFTTCVEPGDSQSADGCQVSVFVDGIKRYRKHLDIDTEKVATFAFKASVDQGSKVDFVVGRDGALLGESNEADATRLVVRITKVSDHPKDLEPSREDVQAVNKAKTKKPRPLPKDQDTTSSTEDVRARYRWAQELYGKGFETYGTPATNRAQAERAIGEWCKEISDARDFNRQALASDVEALLQDKNTDPLLLTILATHAKPESSAKAIEMLAEARQAFANSAYPPEIQAMAHIGTIEVHSKIQPRSPEYRDIVREQSQQAFRKWAEWLKRPMSVFERRMALRRIDHWFEKTPAMKDYFDDFLYELSNQKVYAWFQHVYLTRRHIELAWIERGSGSARSVSDDGWTGFKRHLLQAAHHGVAGWKMAPEYPETPCEMVTVAMGMSGGVAQEGTRFWLDQSAKADFAYAPTYDRYVTSILPKWGGSVEEVVAFARECVATKRFETPIPWVMHSSIYWLNGDGIPYPLLFKIPGLYDDYQKFQRAQSKVDEDEKAKALSNMFAAAYVADRKEDAREIMKEAAGSLREDIVKTWKLDLQKIRSVLNDQISETPEAFLANDLGDNSAVGLSPDGQLLFASTRAGLIRLVEVDTKQEMVVPSPHEYSVTAFGMSSDQRVLLTADSHGTILVHDFPSLRPIKKITHKNIVLELVISDDGKKLMSYSAPPERREASVSVFNLQTGESILSLDIDSLRTGAVAMSRDGKTLLICDNKGVNVWDITKKTKIRTEALGNAVSFSNDGQTYCVARRDGQRDVCQVMDLQTGKVLQQLRGLGQMPMQTNFLDGDRRLVALEQDGTMLEWTIETGKSSGFYQPYRLMHGKIQWARNGSAFALIDNLKRIQLHKVKGEQLGTRMATPLSGTSFINGPVFAEYTRDGKKLVIVTMGNISVWDSSANQGTDTMIGLQGEAQAASLIEGGPSAAIYWKESENEAYVGIFDGKLIVSKFRVPTTNFGRIVFCDLGRKVVVPNRDAALIVDVVTRKEYRLENISQGNGMYYVGISPDGKRIVRTNSPYEIEVLDLTWTESEVKMTNSIRKFKREDNYGPELIGFAPDGNSFALEKGSNTKCSIYNILTGEITPLAADVFYVTYFGNDQLAGSTRENGRKGEKLHIFNLRNGAIEKSLDLAFEENGPHFVSPDGTVLGVVGMYLRAWNTKNWQRITDFAPGKGP